MEAGQIGELSAGTPRRVLLSPSIPGWKQRHDLEVFVTIPPDGTPLVLSSECTHQGCPVEWKNQNFACPCHGSVFDAEGNPLMGPARIPLNRPRLFVEDGALWVKIREKD